MIDGETHKEVINPSSEERWLKLRTHDITSSEVSALFGCCPYLTHFKLWHLKQAATIERLEESEDMAWGKALEPVIAQTLAEKNGWQIRPKKEYIRLPALRIGSSFDFEVEESDGRRILEIKNVNQFAFKDNWIIHEDGSIEAPPHIEFQVQHQMLVSGIQKATIAALVGGSRPRILQREFDEKVGAAILRKVAEFWSSIDRNDPPPPNFAEDARFIFDMHGKAKEGEVLNAHDDGELGALANLFQMATRKRDDAEEEREKLKAQMLMRIGSAEKVQGSGWSISSGMVKEAQVSFTRKAYRNFRLSFKKDGAKQ